ncbi:MAG: LamG-like jellyroll fold domain-containing protein, partial [Planctomycetota bacterium]
MCKVRISVLIVLLVFSAHSFAADKGDLFWMSAYFPSFSDKHTVALWLFDETPYSYNTLTDAGVYEYDLRLFDAGLAPGKFAHALKTSPGTEYNLYYAEWAGKVCKERMRRPKGEPSGLWGPTIAPKKILAALSGQDWTMEFWLKCLSKPDGEVVVLDMGHAYEPGVKMVLEAAAGKFGFGNVYAGYKAACPTDTKSLFDGQWHHIAFTFSAGNSQMKHYLDGRQQNKVSIAAQARKPVPESIIPSSFVRPDGYEVFDKTANARKYRLHRFNLSMGEDRHGAQDLHAMIDEFRISNVVRYRSDFAVPGTFSRNYGPNAPQPAAADGSQLLFASNSPKGVVRLGSRKHLFIDDALLDSKQNLELVCNPPRNRRELNFWPERSAWRPSVVDVDGKIFLYAPESYGSDKGNTNLRISTDGLNFIKPNLGLYEYEGSTDNAFVISHRPLYGNFFKDLRPGIGPEEKYKMTAWLSNRGVYLYISPDGIHWRRNETAMLPIISGGDAETYWDDQRGLYVTFLRRDTGHYTKENPGHGRAAVYFDAREVFKTWPFKKLKKPYFHTFSLPCPTGEGPTIFKENETGQVYRTRAIKYPWAPDTYLAFPWRFKADDETRRVDLGVSRDGLHWKFYAAQKWYVEPPEGSDEVLSMYGLIRRGDQIWQYIDEGGAHGSTRGRSKPRIYARVIQRLDGFVSLGAGQTAGTAVTRPLSFEGNKLTLNVAAAGNVLVEIQDENGKTLPGFSMVDCDAVKTDSIRQVVSWKG